MDNFVLYCQYHRNWSTNTDKVPVFRQIIFNEGEKKISVDITTLKWYIGVKI